MTVEHQLTILHFTYSKRDFGTHYFHTYQIKKKGKENLCDYSLYWMEIITPSPQTHNLKRRTTTDIIILNTLF